jgi:hypothetical protein
MAISIDLLEFYHALFERSCDAVNAMAAALHSFYSRRGFHMLNSKVSKIKMSRLCISLTSLKGELVRDAFRRSLGYAIQWHDSLRLSVQREVDTAIELSDKVIQCHQQTVSVTTIPTTLSPGQCARVLQQRCPCCFGGTIFGRTFEECVIIQN